MTPIVGGAFDESGAKDQGMFFDDGFNQEDLDKLLSSQGEYNFMTQVNNQNNTCEA